MISGMRFSFFVKTSKNSNIAASGVALSPIESKLRERNDHEAPLQVLVSVPKKHFHHAVDRNRVKRQVREAWRRHKSLLVEALASDKQLLVAFVWLSDSMLSTQDVEERVANALKSGNTVIDSN